MRLSILAVLGLSWTALSVKAQVNLPPLPPAPGLTTPSPTLAPAASPLPGIGGGAAPQANSPFPAMMTIIAQNGVEARSGPSAEMYATSRLTFGERVIVLREDERQAGWYAIRPPAGSFSWVSGKNLLLVQGDPRVGVLVSEGNQPISILAGSKLMNKPPNVEVAKAATGSIVTIMDRPQEADGQKWFQIAPTERDVRYIPKEAVMPPQTTSVTPPTWTTPGTGLPSSNWSTPGQFAGGSGTPPVGTPASFSQPGSPWTQYNGVSAQPPQWSQWGKLRRSAVVDRAGQPMYVLEDRTGKPLLYVSTTAGTSLRNYVEQSVCLYGVISYDNTQRTYHIVASHVATP